MFERFRNAVLLILGAAIALRIAWALLQPLLPALIVLAAVLAIYGLLIRRNR